MRRKSGGAAAPDLGYLRGFAETYELGRELGRGGNGVVRLAVQRSSGRQFAVKSIPKVLADPAASERKKAEQIPYLRREVEVLLALRGTLNVANLEAVYEDDRDVHLVLEYCSGGELVRRAMHRKDGFAYSERTVASFLRAVLRTLAQCHAKRIIHRDIKPENFLLASEEPAAPLKAIDFGLALFYDPERLPVTGLNPEGTPWYLAPECCRAKWHPASDVWAVGVMACFLLTGAYPFLDRVSPKMPDLARTLRSICFEELDLTRPEFGALSPGARAFIEHLLVKDPLKRPTADDALRHPFLSGGREGPADRGAGRPLDKQVVQRIQRFAQSSLFKRTVLEHIAADLLSMHFSPDPSTHGGSVFYERSVRAGQAYAAAERSVHGGRGGEGSRHGADRSFRGMAAAALAAVRLERSVHGGRGASQAASRAASVAASREGTQHGGMLSPFAQSAAAASWLDPGASSMRRTGSAKQLAGADRSARGGSTRGGADRSARSGADRSVRGGEGSRHGGSAGMRRVGSAMLLERAGSAKPGPGRSATMFLPVATPYSHRLAELLDSLQLAPGQKIDRAQLQRGLQQIGYHLQEAEVEELFGVVDVAGSGAVGRAEMAAALIDWRAFKDTFHDRWVECARRAFAELDADGTGELSADEIAAAFASHLSPYEVDAAVHQALLEATGGRAAADPSPAVASGEITWQTTAAANGSAAGTAAADANGAGGAAGGGRSSLEAPRINFEHFLALLQAPSGDLDKFDDRLSNHTSRQPSMWGDDLKPVGGKAAAGGCCVIS